MVSGTLHGEHEAHLAAALGMSPRRLRHLFRIHVGVTPAQLARSIRVHAARRLLDRTELPVTEVAFASGFNSVRHFNRSLLEVFHATPLALRARGSIHAGVDAPSDELATVLAAVCHVSEVTARGVAQRLRALVDQSGDGWPWADQRDMTASSPFARRPS